MHNIYIIKFKKGKLKIMRKVFEIKVASSASFYSYLALSGIDFKTKEKSDVIIFTCDMTDAEFAAAVQYCNKLGEERKSNESVEKYKKLHEEYITIQQVKETLDDLFRDISRQAFYKQKEAEMELAEICYQKILEKANGNPFMTETEITELVTKTGLRVLRECGKIVKVDFGNAFIEKEAERELAEICVKTIKKTTLEFILTKKEIIDIVTEIGFNAMMNNDRLTEFLLPGWNESFYKIQ